MHEKSDEEVLLWLRLKNGDRESFAALYQKHVLSLIAYGIRLCPDRDQLKDQIQELFVELWNSRTNLAETDCVRFYLFKALRYKLIRQEKKRHSRFLASRLAAGFSAALLEEPIETAIMEKEVHESYMALLKKAIRELSLRQQEVIQLRFYQGFSNEQIAELMNMNYQSVSNLLYRALCRLKDIMKSPATHAFLTLFFF